PLVIYNPFMSLSHRGAILSGLCALLFACGAHAQQAPSPAGARILLLPRRIVSGERATLAVLDVNGRLTPGVTVAFSNGDRLTTDQSGRALLVAPLNPGVVFGAIEGRRGRVPTTIVAPTETELSLVEINSAPRIASLSDRFDILGHGFCGDADANNVTIGGLRAIVLASSATSLVVLPPADLEPGPAPVKISCGKNSIPAFNMTFLELALHADSSTLSPGEHRVLTVTVRGTQAKIALEAKNLAPDIAELSGGDAVRQSSSGGSGNAAHFEVVGRKRGSFLISIRLVPVIAHPTAKSPQPAH
ncbi:MAG TPA: IPT/TIG domain-containing protein, partial [Candidatus Eremiobacteraceae bacterium]|nr:IPT/TIG domain-containing protein [Candidatus Eremiobacteraceae bacterium]